VSDFIDGATEYFVSAFQIISFFFPVLKNQNGNLFCIKYNVFLRKFLPLFEHSIFAFSEKTKNPGASSGAWTAPSNHENAAQTRAAVVC
jgi:hypothetical protein